MAQNAPKKKPKTTPSTSKRNSVLAPKKGARTIAPKKKNLVAGNRITKKYTAGMTAKTEKTLAGRAGHLELLGGGKKGGKGGAGKGDKGGKKA